MSTVPKSATKPTNWQSSASCQFGEFPVTRGLFLDRVLILGVKIHVSLGKYVDLEQLTQEKFLDRVLIQPQFRRK